MRVECRLVVILFVNQEPARSLNALVRDVQPASRLLAAERRELGEVVFDFLFVAGFHQQMNSKTDHASSSKVNCGQTSRIRAPRVAMHRAPRQLPLRRSIRDKGSGWRSSRPSESQPAYPQDSPLRP